MCVEWLFIRPLVANIAGWFIAFIVSFMGHYLLTFRHLSARWTIALRRFFLVSTCGFLFNEVVYAWLLSNTRQSYELMLGLVLLGLARSEEHTSELQSLMRISYAVFCLKKKRKTKHDDINYIYMLE